MNKIEQVFKKPQAKALAGYITTGYPDVSATLNAVPVMVASGCDIIELGIPFSDPVGDGPVIQQASYRALMNGVTIKTCFDVASILSSNVTAPLVFMSYFNPILHFGIKLFVTNCRLSGISGLIVPDLPVEDSGELLKACRKNGLHLIYMLSPNSTDERIAQVAENASGFIYLISITGVTGARQEIPSGLEELISKIRRLTDVPLCAGFGISTLKQASAIGKLTDGIIVGSRIIQLLDKDSSLQELRCFVKEMKRALVVI